MKICIVGAGPAGLFLARRLLKLSPSRLDLNILDSRPCPFGLLKFGVAPDHPEVKVWTENIHTLGIF